jgi:hypothetical protein
LPSRGRLRRVGETSPKSGGQTVKGFRDLDVSEMTLVEGGSIFSAIGDWFSGLGGGIAGAFRTVMLLFIAGPGRPIA